MTTNSQAPEILAKQVAEWRKEVARLNDLIAHAEGRDSQAASINTPEFRQLLKDYSFYGIERGTPPLIAHIDAKLVQAKLRGMELANEKVFQPDMDEWNARAEKAESRLAEIQRGVEGLTRYTPGLRWGVTGFEGGLSLVSRNEVLALLQPQGQADTSGLPG